MQKFYLITGFMGTGKSTLLQNIQVCFEKSKEIFIDSVSYSLQTSPQKNQHRQYWIVEDLDAYIVKKINGSISQYFTDVGEESFRHLEAICLEEIFDRVVQINNDYPSMKVNVVISLGGGCIFSYETRKSILQFSRMFCQTHCLNLSADIDVINKRLQGSKRTQRPLASQLQKKYTERTEFWNFISEILEYNDISVVELQGSETTQKLANTVWSIINNSSHEEIKKNLHQRLNHGIPMLEMPW